MDHTPASLIERLVRPGQMSAWDRLIELYAPLVNAWARQGGMNETAAAALVEQVFQVVRDKFPELREDHSRSFRGWLRSISVNCYRAIQKAQAKPSNGQPEPVVADPAPSFWDREYKQFLAARALVLMQREFDANIWHAAWLVTVEGIPPEKVAAQMKMTIGAVMTARCRVMARLHVELAGLM